MSTVSAPEDLGFLKEKLNEDYFDSVPAKSEVEFKASSRRKRFTEKGKSFLKDVRSKNRERAYQRLKSQIQKIKNMCDSPETEIEALEAERNKLGSGHYLVGGEGR